MKYLAIPSWANTFLSPLKKEKKPDSGSFFDPEGKPIEYPKDRPWWDESSWNEDFGKDDDTKKKWEDWNTKPKQKNDTKVVTRGDKRPLDDRDINPEYPIKDIDKTSEEVANYMIDKAPVYFGDDYLYFRDYKSGKISREEFSKRLQVSNMEKRKELEKLMPIYNETLKHAYE